MRRGALLALLLGLAATAATPAHATVVDHGTFTSFEVFEPQVITDFPCLEGKAFIASGTESIRGNFVDAGDAGFHFFQIEKHTGTAVPVDGEGPTYIERSNTDIASFNTRTVSGVFTFTHVINDAFVPYVDGQQVGGATIWIHVVEHFVGTDTDGDGVPDDVKVDFSRPRFTCP